MGGDFNVGRFGREKFRVSRTRKSMKIFDAFFRDCVKDFDVINAILGLNLRVFVKF